MPHTSIRRYFKHGMLPQLFVFEACARLGSLTRAAEELHMAQPTASVQIRKLTETVGLPLFEQLGKRLYLTEAGRRVHASCGEMLGMLSNLEQELGDLRGLRSGRLQLAVSSAGKYFAPRMLAEFIQRHPGVEVSLQIHNRQILEERLSDNADDLYIFTGPIENEDIVRQVILSNPLAVFARADHPLANARNIPFARLAEEPFLMREPGSGTRLATQRMFEGHGLRPNIRMEMGTNEAIMQAILAGMGVSILSRYTLGLDADPSRVACLDVQGFPLEHQWYFAYPIGKQLSVVARAFMDFVRAEAANLIPGHFAREDHPVLTRSNPRKRDSFAKGKGEQLSCGL